MGDYRLTRDDVSVGQEFPDVIGKSHFKAGAHHTVDKNTHRPGGEGLPQ